MASEDIVFIVNSMSGARQGDRLRGLLAQRYGSRVLDITESKAETLMARFGERLTACRLIICGGDGSVHSVFEQAPEMVRPPQLPLRIWHNIARCLGWGGGYGGEDVAPLCARLTRADSVALDRWRVVIRSVSSGAEQKQRTQVINNYLSLGFADAKIALDFHASREKNPSLFSNRAINKLWYAGYGIKSAVWDKKEVQSIDQVIAVEVNGQPVDLSKEPLEGIVILNMVTYAGGMNLWGLPEDGSPFSPAALDDGKIEVIGIRSAFHLGQAALGLSSGVRLGQGESVSVFYKPNQPPLPCKIDGEPWLQSEPVHIQITRGPSLRVLTGEVPYVSASVAQKHGRKCGNLNKRASSDTHWDARWFVLTDTRLFYFKNETSLCPQGAIVLSECERAVSESDPDKAFCFALCSTNRKLLLQASSLADMSSWLEALTSSIATHRSAAAPSLLPVPPAHEPSTPMNSPAPGSPLPLSPAPLPPTAVVATVHRSPPGPAPAPPLSPVPAPAPAAALVPSPSPALAQSVLHALPSPPANAPICGCPTTAAPTPASAMPYSHAVAQLAYPYPAALSHSQPNVAPAPYQVTYPLTLPTAQVNPNGYHAQAVAAASPSVASYYSAPATYAAPYPNAQPGYVPHTIYQPPQAYPQMQMQPLLPVQTHPSMYASAYAAPVYYSGPSQGWTPHYGM